MLQAGYCLPKETPPPLWGGVSVKVKHYESLLLNNHTCRWCSNMCCCVYVQVTCTQTRSCRPNTQHCACAHLVRMCSDIPSTPTYGRAPHYFRYLAQTVPP